MGKTAPAGNIAWAKIILAFPLPGYESFTPEADFVPACNTVTVGLRDSAFATPTQRPKTMIEVSLDMIFPMVFSFLIT